MKNQFLIGFVFILLASFFACAPQSQNEDPTVKNNEESTSETKFVANPQPVAEQEVKTLAIGAEAPDFKLPGVDGKFYQLQDFKEADILTIIFTCNHCPTAQAYEDRLISLAKEYDKSKVSIVAISPNSPIGLLYEECGYTDLGDTYEDMVLRAEYKNFPFPYLYDGDDQAVSLKYGPAATPHAYVFDKERKLQYIGRIDASEKPGTADAEDLRAAIDALLAGNPVANAETKTFGCSTKWGWKQDYKKKVDADWASASVELDEIDEAGIKKLLSNESQKLYLINVWATWCGPCIIEYPDLIATHRMFKGRDFEMISVSADKPEQKEKALEFLKEKESAIKNYIFNNEDKYALIEAIDPNWNGALPYTLLVEPAGKVAYAHQGTVDLLELRRAIVEHPMIGRYY